MRDLAVKRQTECEHVYTTPHGCVAAETRLGRQVQLCSNLQPIWLARELQLNEVKGGRIDSFAYASPGLPARKIALSL